MRWWAALVFAVALRAADALEYAEFGKQWLLKRDAVVVRAALAARGLASPKSYADARRARAHARKFPDVVWFCYDLNDVVDIECVNRIVGLKARWWSKNGFCDYSRTVDGQLDCLVLPRDFDAYTNSTTTWIFKPYSKGGGEGVTVDLSRVTRSTKGVLQELVAHPARTADKLKWDIRAYALLSNGRLYLHEDALVRFASTPAQVLTNSSINGKNSTTTWSVFASEKFSHAEMSRAIAQALDVAFLTEWDTHERFQLLGVDVIFDARTKRAHVLEINGQPSLGLSRVDRRYDELKRRIAGDMISLVFFGENGGFVKLSGDQCLMP